MALSGITLMYATPELVKSITGKVEASDELAQYTDGHPAIRHFRRGQKVTYGYKVLNAALKDNEGDPEVWTPEDKSRLPMGGVLQLGQQFQAGAYALQLVDWVNLAKELQGVDAPAIDFQLG